MISGCLRGPAKLVSSFAWSVSSPADDETSSRGRDKRAGELREAICRLRLAHGAAAAGSHVTLSIGVATEVPAEDMSSDLLVARADQALYAAKHSGRDRVLSADKALSVFGRAQGAAPRGARKTRLR
jgi:hypothetical protein